MDKKKKCDLRNNFIRKIADIKFRVLDEINSFLKD